MDTKALFKLTNGMYVVCSKKGGKFNGQIADVIFQVTAHPPTIAASISKQNYTHEFINESKVFTVSILSESTPMEFIGRFGFKSGRDFDKLNGIKQKAGVTGAPVVLEHAIACLEAKVINSLDVGDHTIFIGEVVEAEVLEEGRPMTYAYYHEIKKGLTPKAAPTYIENQEQQKKNEREVSNMKKYRCTVCGYVYDPEKGDPDNGVKPGTPFEKLPDNWVCPVCGADKSAFEELS